MRKKDKVEKSRIETRLEIQTYLDKLKYALQSESAVIEFAKERFVDKERNIQYTNQYTVSTLFPDVDVVTALKEELIKLTVDEYIETVKDINRPKYSEFRVFVRKYSKLDVYIKIRVELVNLTHVSGEILIFVMSFHFAEFKFNEDEFPYKRNSGEGNEKK